MQRNSELYKTIQELKEALAGLANPTIITAIHTLLSSTQESFSLEFFTTLKESVPMPATLHKLFVKMKGVAEIAIAEGKWADGDVTAVLTALLPTTETEILWPECINLLKIPKVQKLKNETAFKLKKYLLDNPTVENIREFFDVIFEEDEIEEIDSFCQEHYSTDCATQIARAVKSKPKLKLSFKTVAQNDISYFENKDILVLLVNKTCFQKTIIQASKKDDGTFVFVLDYRTFNISKVRLEISPDFRLNLYEIVQEPMLISILNAYTKEGSCFKLNATAAMDCAGRMLINPAQPYLLHQFSEKTSLVSKISGFISKPDTTYYSIVLASVTGNLRYKISVGCLLKKGDSRIITSADISKVCISEYLNGEWTKEKIADPAVIPKMVLEREHLSSTYSFPHISAENIHDYVEIKCDESLASRSSKLKLEQITRKIDFLVNLLDQDNALLHPLVDDWISNKLARIDESLSQPLEESIAEILGMYKEVNVTKSYQDVLLQIVREANWKSNLKTKESTVFVARIMDLLQQAQKYAAELSGKSAFFVIGNTGSGKSTTICKLLRAPLLKTKNHVGDTVYKVRDNVVGNFPKIGQALGTSETLYTRGYKLKDVDHYATDCAGFEDTRGDDYELCTNLSMDMVLREANVSSIILVIPINAFLLDRGNPIITLASTVSGRFPNLFDIEHPDHNKLFILITKSNSVPGSVVSHFSSRLTSLFNEEQDQIDSICSAGRTPTSTSYFRLRIWHALLSLNTKGHLTILDIEDSDMIGDLIAQYSVDAGPKIQCREALANLDIRKKFGDIIQLTVHTWHKLILEQFLTIDPAKIATLEAEVKHLETITVNNRNKINAGTQELNNISEAIYKLDVFLEVCKTDSAVPLLDQQFQQDIENLHKANNASLLTQIKSTEESIVESEELVGRLKDNIARVEQENLTANQNLKTVRQEIQSKGEGSHHQNLYSIKYTPNQILSISTWKSEAHRQKAIAEMRTGSSTDFLPGYQSVIAKEHTGVGLHLALITKEYSIVPVDDMGNVDEVAWQDFKDIAKLGSGEFSATFRAYNAKLEKMNCRVSNPREILYSFETTWKKGTPLPWVEIYHELPRHVYFASALKNLESDRRRLEDTIAENNRILNGALFVTGLNKRLETETRRQDLLKQNLQTFQAECNAKRDNIVIDFLQTTKTNKINAKKLVEDNLVILKAQLESDTHSVTTKKQQLVQLNATRKRFAAAIYQQLEVAKAVRKFADFLIARPPPDPDPREQLLFSDCENFIAAYDSNFDKLVSSCQDTLNFT